MTQTAPLTDRVQRHGQRVNFVRNIFPIFAVFFLLVWGGIGQFERLVLFRQLISFVQKELRSVGTGYILTFTAAEHVLPTTRKIEFEEFGGTGLADEPFHLKGLRLTTQKAGAIEYKVHIDQAFIDPVKEELSTPESFILWGPDKLKATSSNAVINLHTFALQAHGPSEITDGTGLKISSENGLRFDPTQQQFYLMGPASVSMHVN